MAPPRSLLSLNQDVLREILAHLLLDTLLERNRAAVLRTCSPLHELGLPLLYRVVDLRFLRTRKMLVEAWEGLFGETGLLTEDGRIEGLGKAVFKLKLGGQVGNDGSHSPISGFELGSVDVPNCSSLLVDLATFSALHCTLVQGMLIQLPLLKLLIDYIVYPEVTCNSFGRPVNMMLNLPIQPPKWSDLQQVVFCGTIWFDEDTFGEDDDSREPEPKLSFSEWSFRILVLELAFPQKNKDTKEALEVFLDLDSEWNHEEFLRSTERIEFRISGMFAGEFEKEFREEVGKIVARGLDAFESRVLGMMVFVREDGEERRLIE